MKEKGESHLYINLAAIFKKKVCEKGNKNTIDQLNDLKVGRGGGKTGFSSIWKMQPR